MDKNIDKNKVLFIGESLNTYQQISQRLNFEQFFVTKVETEQQLLAHIANSHSSIVIIENASTTQRDAIELSIRSRVLFPCLKIIVLADNSSEDLAIRAIKAGVNDYFKSPLDYGSIVDSIYQLSKTGVQSAADSTVFPYYKKKIAEFIGECAPIAQMKESIVKYAKCHSNVLITGETGTGKELVARLIHQMSDRVNRPLICLNCAAIPDTLLESELFGYEKGAFTGAHSAREGKLTHADRGTLFLDEIGDMTLLAQAKILRAIETKVVQKLGSKHSTAVNVRVIAATNQPLQNLVEQKQFRKDLFFRLNIARVHIPPLRERKSDIELLCGHFIQENNRKFNAGIRGVHDSVLEYFIKYDWPGNVRELKNIMEATFINHPKNNIQFNDLPEHYKNEFEKKCCVEDVKDSDSGERDKLLVALLSTNWNKSKAAEKLNWSRMTLYRKMEKHQITSTKTLKKSEST